MINNRPLQWRRGGEEAGAYLERLHLHTAFTRLLGDDCAEFLCHLIDDIVNMASALQYNRRESVMGGYTAVRGRARRRDRGRDKGIDKVETMTRAREAE